MKSVQDLMGNESVSFDKNSDFIERERWFLSMETAFSITGNGGFYNRKRCFLYKETMFSVRGKRMSEASRMTYRAMRDRTILGR
jgi:hypothetical protein